MMTGNAVENFEKRVIGEEEVGLDNEDGPQADSHLTSDPPPGLFATTFSLAIEPNAASYLKHSVGHSNTATEALIPREVIASAVGNTNLQAELGRPILVGTYNGLPAYLLRTKFSFQRTGTVAAEGGFWRIQAADLTLVFEDAGDEGPESETDKAETQHPAVASWYPILYEGNVSFALKHNNMEGSLGASYFGVGAEVKVGQRTEINQSSQMRVHSLRGGGRHLNSLTWSISEDRIAKHGIPPILCLPLIITHRPHRKNRFLARVTVKAHFGFWRGAVARKVPVLGRNDEPIYFDPITLQELAQKTKMATEMPKSLWVGLTGPDGRTIAEAGGAFDGFDLRKWCSIDGTGINETKQQERDNEVQ